MSARAEALPTDLYDYQTCRTCGKAAVLQYGGFCSSACWDDFYGPEEFGDDKWSGDDETDYDEEV